MKVKLSHVLGLLAVLSMLAGLAAPEALAQRPVPPDAQTKLADPNNLFPNGIGEIDCKGVNLVVGTQVGPQIASPVQNFWPLWGEKTGGTVELQEFPFGDLFEKIRTGFISGASPFDIIIYASDWAGDIMGPGYVLEVPQKVQDQVGYDYLIPTYRDRILSWGGKVYGLPYDGDAHMMYYRRDLLTDPKWQAEFKAKYGYDLPAPPNTWKQYYDVAEFFNGKEIDGQVIWGAGTAFKRKAQSYWTYLGVAAAFAKAPDDPAYFFDPRVLKKCAEKCYAALTARSQVSFSPDEPPHPASSAHLLTSLPPFHPPFASSRQTPPRVRPPREHLREMAHLSAGVPAA
jgi:ABC-type glycerol-3-phosphate transport system substrate-binding protein